MKRSRSALKVENGIDFSVLGCSGELIRYNLIDLSSALEGPQGLWRPLPALPPLSAPQKPAPQPSPCKPHAVAHLLSQGSSSESGRAGDYGAGEALEDTAHGSGMCEQRSDDHLPLEPYPRQ